MSKRYPSSDGEATIVCRAESGIEARTWSDPSPGSSAKVDARDDRAEQSTHEDRDDDVGCLHPSVSACDRARLQGADAVHPGLVSRTPSEASERLSPPDQESDQKGSACHVSIRASGIGSPRPSVTLPRIQMASSIPSPTTNGPSGHGRAMPKNGPTVCEGVGRSSVRRLHDASRLMVSASPNRSLTATESQGWRPLGGQMPCIGFRSNRPSPNGPDGTCGACASPSWAPACGRPEGLQPGHRSVLEEENTMSEHEVKESPLVPRRTVLKAAAIGAVATGLGAFLAACGIKTSSPSASAGAGASAAASVAPSTAASVVPSAAEAIPFKIGFVSPQTGAGRRLRRTRPLHHRARPGQARTGLPGRREELRDHDRPEGRPIGPGKGGSGRQRPDHERQGRSDPGNVDPGEQQSDRRCRRGRRRAAHQHGRALGSVLLRAPEGPGQAGSIQVHVPSSPSGWRSSRRRTSRCGTTSRPTRRLA